ncbi:MAG: hypothetical protein A2Y33_02710 [Spirochaetes bacterium GWF1_51_8]|nr:MAG: hypothetical protein A2Y33_02710 [Spirochaetes bacterium GWF1_51_8]
MEKILWVVLALIFPFTALSAQKASVSMPSNHQTVYEEFTVSAALMTNIQSRLIVYMGGTLAGSNFFSNMQAEVKVAPSIPGTNILRAEVWEVIPIVWEIPGASNMPIEFSNKILMAVSESAVVKEFRLTPGGWIFIILGWGSILCLCVYTYFKIFGIKKDKIVEPLEIDTLDGK